MMAHYLNSQRLMQSKISTTIMLVLVVTNIGFLGGAFAQSVGENATEQANKDVKILRLEGELRQLLGRVEQLEYEMQQLKQSAGSSGLPPNDVPALPDTPSLTLDSTGQVSPDTALEKQVSQAVQASQAPSATPDDGSLANNEETLAPVEIVPETPLDLSIAQDPDKLPIDDVGQVPTSQDADALYQAGFQAILIGDFVFAEEQFRQFLALHEAHEKTPDATHWLGESLLQQSAFGDAAEIFQKGYQAHESSDKAPDMLLKLGIALSRGGEQEIGCRTYQEVAKRYPETSNAFKARLEREVSLAKCEPS